MLSNGSWDKLPRGPRPPDSKGGCSASTGLAFGSPRGAPEAAGHRPDIPPIGLEKTEGSHVCVILPNTPQGLSLTPIPPTKRGAEVRTRR